MEKNNLLDQPLSDLGLSKSFIQQSALMGYKTLRDIGNEEPGQLLMAPGFSYHWLAELSSFLAKEKLLYLLQPLQGSNSG